MIYKIQYHSKVVSTDIPKLSKEWRVNIQKAIEIKLTTQPEVFGIPLRHALKGYRKVRVGSYRIVFKIENQSVKIFIIQHRSTAYKTAKKECSSF